jgi:DNA-binding GntR family transcriptional regulator
MPRLTPEQAIRLEAEYRGTRLSRRALARRYRVDERTVRNHVRGLARDLVAVVVARQLRCPVSDSEDVRSLRVEKMT